MLPERLANIRVLEDKVKRVPLEVARRLEAVLLEPGGEVPVREQIRELELLLGASYASVSAVLVAGISAPLDAARRDAPDGAGTRAELDGWAGTSAELDEAPCD